MRVAIYARYSSDNQRDASIEDQVSICREHAKREGWTIVETYTDRAISGASLIRPGIQALLSDAINGKLDIVLTEALDRLSRDQEDIAGIYKRMSFAGVKIITLSEGEVSNLHIGLKGTMNAMFLQDLADKTRRGLRGRIERGKSGGGNSYGYAVVRTVDTNGEIGRGERNIIEEEAEIIRRIMTEYADGISPRKIAHKLNDEGVAGPRGNAWGPSTIHGSAKRGNGILNNQLYIGRMVWNRQHFIKDPDTGKRVSRMNPEEDWVIKETPELRIVDQDLWERVKARQASTKSAPGSKSGNKLAGYGIVRSPAVMSKDFELADGKKLSKVELEQPRILHDAEDQEMTDYIVGVDWKKTLPISKAQTFTGAFANQNVVCKLRDPATLDFLKKAFGN